MLPTINYNIIIMNTDSQLLFGTKYVNRTVGGENNTATKNNGYVEDQLKSIMKNNDLLPPNNRINPFNKKDDKNKNGTYPTINYNKFND